jgi:hypothetical protein
MAELDQKKAAVIAAASPLAKKKKTLQASSLSDAAAAWYKILAYSESGAGKTLAIVGFLRAGLKVFVFSTDIGGNGLSSVREALKAQQLEHLMANVVYVEVSDYETSVMFLDNPDIIEVGGVNLRAWNPDIIVWDGFSNWQENHLCGYILDMDPLGGDKSSELRKEGLVGELMDYNAVRRGTLKAIDKFLNLHGADGKVWHKYVTCLTDLKAREDAGGTPKKMPLLVGSARTYMGPAFDLILEMTAKSTGNKIEYKYKCNIGGNSMSKKRGLNVNTEEDGDMFKLWQKITQVSQNA